MIAALESWANELHSRANRVRQLIGDKHWLSDGHQKEYILREFLIRHLPANLSVTRGFICPGDPEFPPSGEIDILITDPSLHVPWFNEGGLIITPPDGVVAQIHVKTGFGSVEINDVIASLSWAAAVCNCDSSPTIWAGGFFFRNDLTTENLAGSVKKILETQIEGIQRAKIVRFNACLAVLDGPIVFIGVPQQSPPDCVELRVRAFKGGKLSAALFVCALTTYLRSRDSTYCGGDALTNLLSRLEYEMISDFTVRSRTGGQRSLIQS